MSRSVHEILESAFEEIKESHGIAVETVRFETVHSRSPSRIGYHFVGVSFDAKTCTPSGIDNNPREQ